MFTDYTKGMITEYFVRGAVSHIYRGSRGYPLLSTIVTDVK